MHSFRLRFVTALLLLATLVGATVPAAAEGEHQETATLTIHSRFCPAGYEGSDLFGDCHGDPGIQGVQFQVMGPRTATATPGVSGNLTFAELPAGTYQLSNSLPSGMQHPAVYCSSGDGAEATRLDIESLGGDDIGGRLDLVGGDALICDWYTIPNDDYNRTTANLTIHNRFCPVGYKGANEFGDCHDNVGIAYVMYSVSGPDSRSAMLEAGDVTFSWLKPGSYVITSDSELPAQIACSDFNDASNPFFQQSVKDGETIKLTLKTGISVVCDWFVYPPESFYKKGASLPVMVVACPEDRPIGLGQGALPNGCFGIEQVKVTVYPTLAGTDYADSCTTDDAGNCEVTIPYAIPLTAELDVTDLPDGYAPKANPIQVIAYSEFAAVIFLILPDPRGD